jgi:branched-chain amino acid transport system ATP-binding protein
MRFGGVRALADVSFSVTAGEKVAIIGPNGAGKTTLFNVLNGQLSPTSGRVYLFGRDITRMAMHRRTHLGLARSFQVTSLFSNLTVLGNAVLALNGTRSLRFQMLRSVGSYGEVFVAAKELLRAWALWERRNEPVRALSHGEQRRLEIAVTLAAGPKVLLLDEPSAGLTAAESSQIIDRIRSFGRDITVMLVAHDMDLVFGIAERIIVFHQGRAVASGTVDEIRADTRVREIYMGREDDGNDVGAD